MTTSIPVSATVTGDATFRVDGMTCDHCRHAVTAEVSAIPGIQTVDVDVTGGTLTIYADQPIDRAQIASAVDEAGYTLRA